ncbi:MAG: biotin/lipoyl-containing protein [Candidatus Bathyarchaeia archaeon]|nr:biotin/lipoyl-binding protein [Candidatus Bathyarchaeota archaeon]
MPTYEVLVDGKPRKIEVSKTGEKTFSVKLDGETFTVEVPEGKPTFGKELQIKIGGKVYAITLQEVSKTKPFTVKVEEASFKVELKTPTSTQRLVPVAEQAPSTIAVKAAKPKQAVSGTVTAPMAGKIISIKVKRGEQVKAGQVLCILEAMKMENEITAPTAGSIREILVSEGASVNEGDPLFVIG